MNKQLRVFYRLLVIVENQELFSHSQCDVYIQILI